MKTLQIVTAAYRCNIEEQDDPVLWISQAMKAGGADLHLLLEGQAVDYAAKGQEASGLSFGGKKQTQPPRIEDDLKRLVATGAQVFALDEDVAARGLERADLIEGIKGVSRADLARLFAGYNQIWRW
ncbi:MAG TPA: DsrH/TusB family sulfur metabolism protein [Burkholderiales bacterium]|nr:DsrH/TusB family sulfur metabolism protein [Burkholderiales bacterium]